MILDEIGNLISVSGSGIIIASQSRHLLPPLPVEQHKLLAATPVEELLSLSFLLIILTSYYFRITMSSF